MSRHFEEDHSDPATSVEDVDGPSGSPSDLGGNDELKVKLFHHLPLDQPATLQSTDMEIQGLLALAAIVTAASHLELSPV